MRISSPLSAPAWAGAKRRAVAAVLLTGLLTAAMLAGCSSDDPSPVATPDMADVNTYVGGLNSWPETLPDSEGVTGNATGGTDTVGETDYSCSTTPYSITQTPDKIVIFDPDDEVFWLGALLQGDGFRGGIGSLAELAVRQRAPIDISVDILGLGTTRTVESPDPATINQAIGELITLAENSGQTFGSNILFSQTLSHSVSQSAIKMGLSAHYLGGEASASLDYSQNAAQTTVSAYFLQKMFTTSITLPQLPSDLFSSEFTEDRLQEQVALGRIGPDNQPAYISSIVWGRLMMLTITSSSSETQIKAALSASYDGAVGGGSGSVDAASLRLLNEASIQLVTLGGDQSAALGYLRSGALADFFAEDAPLTTAVPLSFTVRDVQTNEKALVSETTSYNVKTCSPVAPNAIGAQYRVKLDNLVFTDTDCDGFADSDIEAYWNIQANLPASSVLAKGDYYTANSGAVYPLGGLWSNWVDVKFDGTGAITIAGTLTDDDDGSGDDLIGSWNISKNTSTIAPGSFTVSGGNPADEGCTVKLQYTIQKGADVYP